MLMPGWWFLALEAKARGKGSDLLVLASQEDRDLNVKVSLLNQPVHRTKPPPNPYGTELLGGKLSPW